MKSRCSWLSLEYVVEGAACVEDSVDGGEVDELELEAFEHHEVQQDERGEVEQLEGGPHRQTHAPEQLLERDHSVNCSRVN